MGPLIIHWDSDLLELNGSLLAVGDQVEMLHLGSWLAGTVAHDQRGWYFLTSDQMGIRLQTGLLARLSQPTSQSLPLPVRLKQCNQCNRGEREIYEK